jgi:hypothetical protein
LNQLAKEIIPIVLALEIWCFLLQSFNVFGGLLIYPLGTNSSLLTLSGWFNISLLSGLVGGGAIAISIVGLLFRQNTYAIYALLIFGFGVLFNGVSSLVLAIPNTIGALFSLINMPSITDPIAFVITIIIGYAMFWFLLKIVLQRDL